MSETVEALRVQLEDVKRQAAIRERELAGLVEKSRDIFTQDMAHQTKTLEGKYAATISRGNAEIERLNGVIEMRNTTIAELGLKVASADVAIEAAIREQRQKTIADVEKLKAENKMLMGCVERLRYEKERDAKITSDTLTIEVVKRDTLFNNFKEMTNMLVSFVEEYEEQCRSLLCEMETVSWSRIVALNDANWTAKSERKHYIGAALHQVHDHVLREIRQEPSSLPACAEPSMVANNIIIAAAGVVGPIVEHLHSQSRRLCDQNNQCERLSLCVGTELERIQRATNDFSNQFSHCSDRVSILESKLSSALRALSRRTAMNDVIQVTEEAFTKEIALLRSQLHEVKEKLRRGCSEDMYISLQSRIKESENMVSGIRRELTLSTNKNIVCEETLREARIEIRRLEQVVSWRDTSLEDLHRRIAEQELLQQPQKNIMQPTPSNDNAIKKLQERLATAEAERKDLRQLLKVQQKTLSVCSVATEGSDREPVPDSLTHQKQNSEAVEELQGLVFSLRRERDAWKRKADAAFAQVSHAEEQRLTAVHRYLELVGRKEDDYAVSIISPESKGPQEAPKSVVDMLIPGGAPLGAATTVMASPLLPTIPKAGRERAERMLEERASDLRAQTHKMHQARESVRLREISVARREDTLRHEKTALLLKKGNVQALGDTGTEVILSTQHDDDDLLTPQSELVCRKLLAPLSHRGGNRKESSSSLQKKYSPM